MEHKSATPESESSGAFNSKSDKAAGPARKRSISGSGGLLSKFPFMRSAADSHRPRSRHGADDVRSSAPPGTAASSPTATAPYNPAAMPNPAFALPQQPKTRRRRGSLRKVALLGRGAQRERRESRSGAVDTRQPPVSPLPVGSERGYGATPSPPPPNGIPPQAIPKQPPDGYGLGISDVTPRPSVDGYSGRLASNMEAFPAMPTLPPTVESPAAGATNISRIVPRQNGGGETAAGYSTTDDEDALHMSPRADVSLSSSSRPLGHSLPSIQRRRSATAQRAKSPLALTPLAGLSTTPLAPSEVDWDYSETEWWGWVVLAVTWIVFVTGMGSCFGVWSWAWDVGTTPYAPPELEDDPTLPIVGYYPSLIILSGVMAWVWVVVAWVGMKYFRHARVSGD